MPGTLKFYYFLFNMSFNELNQPTSMHKYFFLMFIYFKSKVNAHPYSKAKKKYLFIYSSYVVNKFLNKKWLVTITSLMLLVTVLIFPVALIFWYYKFFFYNKLLSIAYSSFNVSFFSMVVSHFCTSPLDLFKKISKEFDFWFSYPMELNFMLRILLKL